MQFSFFIPFRSVSIIIDCLDLLKFVYILYYCYYYYYSFWGYISIRNGNFCLFVSEADCPSNIKLYHLMDVPFNFDFFQETLVKNKIQTHIVPTYISMKQNNVK